MERNRKAFILHPGVLLRHRPIQLVQDERVIVLQLLRNWIVVNLSTRVLDFQSMVASARDSLDSDLR